MSSMVGRWMGWKWAAVLVVLVGGGPARASAELRTVLAELAGNLARILEGRGEDSLAIGQFSGPAAIQTSAGPGISEILAEELKKKGITVKTRAKVGVKGEYKLAELPAENADDRRLGVKVLAVSIEVKLEDALGNPVGDFTFKRTIRGEATVLHMVGVPASLPPGGTERERDKEVRKQVTDPSKAAIKGTIVRSKAGSPYAVEILVEGKGRPAKDEDGLPFVAVKRGESYAVRLINESDHEAAVQLRIDGLSMFAFSELREPDKLADGKDNPRKGEPRYTAVIVPAKKGGKPGVAVIRGWHVNNKETDKFTVTEYAKSAAGTLKLTADIGTITATFQAAWEGKNAPEDEPGRRRGGQGDATGRGDRIGQEYREVVRNFGVIRDAIAVRYTKPKDKK